jgi:hypothetical protein
MVGAEPVEMRAVLAPQVQHVLEPGRRDERVRAPFRSRSAFVAIVVPCVKRHASSAPTARAAATTESSWRAWVGSFAVRSSPSSKRTASVNVPPTSIPRIFTGQPRFLRRPEAVELSVWRLSYQCSMWRVSFPAVDASTR